MRRTNRARAVATGEHCTECLRILAPGKLTWSSFACCCVHFPQCSNLPHDSDNASSFKPPPDVLELHRRQSSACDFVDSLCFFDLLCVCLCVCARLRAIVDVFSGGGCSLFWTLTWLRPILRHALYSESDGLHGRNSNDDADIV